MMYIYHLPLVATLISGYGACYAFSPRAFNSKSHLSIQGSTTKLFASRDDQKILIVGGGIAGLSIAHYLKKNDIDNNCEVTLLEKEESVDRRDRGSASVNSYCTIDPKFGKSSVPVMQEMIIESQSIFSDWIQEIQYDGEVEDQGVIIPKDALTTEDLKQWNGRIKSVDEIRQKQPLLSESINEWAYFETGVKYNAKILLKSLRAACENQGVVMNLGEQWDVESLTFNDDGSCAGVKLADGNELSGTVVVANGNSFNSLMKDKSGNAFDVGEIEALESQCLVMKPKNNVLMNERVVSIHSFILQNPDGTIFVGDSGSYRNKDNTASADATIASAAEMVPSVVEWDIVENFVGLRARAPDSIPILGEIKNCGNLYVAGGYASYGTTIAPKAAQLLGTLILNGMEGLNQSDQDMITYCKPDREYENNDIAPMM